MDVMKLPPIPAPPQLDLPSQLVISIQAMATIWAIANVVLGFIYLLFGIKVFRVMTTITAALWGLAAGVFLGALYLIRW